MEQRTEQERMNNIHSGWEKYKELNPGAPISPEFDKKIEERMWEANGIKEPLTESEKVQAQAEHIANSITSYHINKAGEQLAEEDKISEESAKENAKKRRFKFYKAAIIIAGLGTAVLFKDQIGGAVKDVVVKIIEWDNEKFNEGYEDVKDSVEEITGMTTDEITEKGRNYGN